MTFERCRLDAKLRREETGVYRAPGGASAVGQERGGWEPESQHVDRKQYVKGALETIIALKN